MMNMVRAGQGARRFLVMEMMDKFFERVGFESRANILFYGIAPLHFISIKHIKSGTEPHGSTKLLNQTPPRSHFHFGSTSSKPKKQRR
jgi:hypothetical protein